MGWFLEWAVVNPSGVDGGILVFWDNRMLQLVGLEVRKFLVLCQFKIC